MILFKSVELVTAVEVVDLENFSSAFVAEAVFLFVRSFPSGSPS